MGPYKVNDVIVWSSNKKCLDVFHASCIESWFHQKKNYSCPCCRQDFVLLDEVFNNDDRECCSSSAGRDDEEVEEDAGRCDDDEEVEILQRFSVNHSMGLSGEQ